MEVKSYLIAACLIVAFVLLLPAAIVYPFSGKHHPPASNGKTEAIKASVLESTLPLEVTVYRSSEKKVQTVPIEQYVIGVVASEMPADFEMEALKAQALAARTYIVNYLLNSPDMNIPENADVTDTIINQVYMDDQQLKKLWGSDYDWKMAKIKKAVASTKGQIITYKGKPITASFFSTSNGYTESAGAYWQHNIPYLKSVPSPWDLHSPKYFSREKIPVSEVDQQLDVKLNGNGRIGKVIQTTPGHRVGKIRIDGKDFTGREVRKLLNLRSTDFTMKQEGDQVVITTRGWGHGVGMSQYGANGMAKQGKNYKEIIKHYYSGVSISNMNRYMGKLMAIKTADAS
ncbi:MAG TPA: stage II sporulation protein D [Bacillales bacterium]|nr:stage II sporulation protein D [Bacillales bacterium]